MNFSYTQRIENAVEDGADFILQLCTRLIITDGDMKGVNVLWVLCVIIISMQIAFFFSFVQNNKMYNMRLFIHSTIVYTVYRLMFSA